MTTREIAVIGGGAAGLAAAYLLSQAHRVTLFEREPRLGGHARTVVLARGPDAGTALDVAFMVLNDRNYPTLQRLLDRLGGIARRPSEMSFGYQSPDGAVQYALNWRPGYAAAVGAPAPARAPDVRLLGEIVRFFRLGGRALDGGALGDATYGAFLAANAFTAAFVETYALPMGAALWSSAPARVADMPAAFVLAFYRHHGMLSLDDGPGWQTLVGGCETYVAKIRAALGDRVVTGAAGLALARVAGGVEVRGAGRAPARFDAAVVATHADEALALLADPDEAEARLLGAWRYQRSRAVLHSDERAMPADRGAWASWNYVQAGPHAEAAGPTLTYHLDRLQGLAGLAAPYFLTLNPAFAPRPELVHGEYAFAHPAYDAAAIATQAPLAALGGSRATWFCGSYLGNGFHEDAVRAGAAVAAAFGVAL